VISNIPLVQLCTCCLISGRCATVLYWRGHSGLQSMMSIYISYAHIHWVVSMFVCFSHLYKFGGTPVHDTLVCVCVRPTSVPPPVTRTRIADRNAPAPGKKKDRTNLTFTASCAALNHTNTVFLPSPLTRALAHHISYHLTRQTFRSQYNSYNCTALQQQNAENTQTINHHPPHPPSYHLIR
jgi:hypothetical protein